jgi:TatD family hydrolase
MMNLIDTHCHIHDVADFDLPTAEILRNARDADVGQIITVGTDVQNSRQAVEFATQHEGVFALIGIHPGVETEQNIDELEEIIRSCHSGLDPESRKNKLDGIVRASRPSKTASHPGLTRASRRVQLGAADVFEGSEALTCSSSLRAQRSNPADRTILDRHGDKSPRDDTGKLRGFGDIGLDYYYKPYDRARQIKLLEQQLDLAVKYDLPVSFHVREAFDDFWAVFDNFPKQRGTLHSYTDNLKNMEKGLSRGLYVSLNGILTFNREEELNKVFVQLPQNRVIFETDAPYLAPKPHRGKANQPAYIRDVAEFFAVKRGIAPEEIAKSSTKNAKKLFNL